MSQTKGRHQSGIYELENVITIKGTNRIKSEDEVHVYEDLYSRENAVGD